MKDACLDKILNEVSCDAEVHWNEFCDKNILVTGATGLIGSLLVRALLNANKNLSKPLSVIAVVRNKEKALQIFEEYEGNKYLKFVIADITKEFSVDQTVDYIFHCASVTASKEMVSSPVETIMTSIFGTRNLLELAKKNQVKSFVYVSSMEVYGAFENFAYVDENNIGFINPLIVRSNYPESKRLCENMCVAYLNQYQVSVKIARLAQTFGAGVLKGENRVFAQFAKSVILKKDIVLHTKGLSEGNYCNTGDAIRALLILAERGKNGEAYNVSNEKNHISIADMANLVVKEFSNNSIKVVFDIPETNTFGYAAETHIKLNSQKMMSLGWTPRYDLRDTYCHLIECMLSRKSLFGLNV